MDLYGVGLVPEVQVHVRAEVLDGHALVVQKHLVLNTNGRLECELVPARKGILQAALYGVSHAWSRGDTVGCVLVESLLQGSLPCDEVMGKAQRPRGYIP